MMQAPSLITWLLILSVPVVLLLVWLRHRHKQTTSKEVISQDISTTAPLIDATPEDIERRIIQHADNAQKLINSFQRFVPKQFIAHFKGQELDTLSLGSAVETEVSIMFCDIRGFTTLAEQMTPKELMNFLNSYFYRMNDPIHQNHGFIDKFIGDAIMALFDRKQDTSQINAFDAISAAIELYKALDIYNTHRNNSGYDSISISIGLHHGNVVIGTVGSPDRMDTTVIGDAVNVAERIERLAAAYRTDILVTDTLLILAHETASFANRFVDRLKVRGRQQYINVYEVFEHLPASEQAQKRSTAEYIQRGVQLRIAGHFDAAIVCFEEALSNAPQDKLLEYHLLQCTQARNQSAET